jgi:hypothetical protein
VTAALTNQFRRGAVRNGISLVELVVVMSAATVILTISAALLHRVMLAHSAARAFTDVERTSLRLANSFRSDVHQAVSATMFEPSPADGPFLRLELPSDQLSSDQLSSGKRLEYRYEQGAILRMALDGERTVAREVFDFRQEINVAAQKDGPRLLTLSISARPPGATSEDGGSLSPAHAVPVRLQVEAALHRDSLP